MPQASSLVQAVPETPSHEAEEVDIPSHFELLNVKQLRALARELGVSPHGNNVILNSVMLAKAAEIQTGKNHWNDRQAGISDLSTADDILDLSVEQTRLTDLLGLGHID